MKRIFLLLVVVSAFVGSLRAQGSEIGLFMGLANYSGDLTANTMSSILESKMAYGVFYRYNITDRFAVRGNLFRGTVSAKDANSDQLWQRRRNLSFQSPILELGVTPEVNIYTFTLKRSGNTIIPYAYVGLAGFYFNPKAEYRGKWYDLQPLGTEGQGLEGSGKGLYNRINLAMAGGIGVKIAFSERGSVGIEFGTRPTLTDYLDDLGGSYPDLAQLEEQYGQVAAALSYRTPEFTGVPSTVPAGEPRTSSKHKDWYGFSGLSVTFILDTKEEMADFK